MTRSSQILPEKVFIILMTSSITSQIELNLSIFAPYIHVFRRIWLGGGGGKLQGQYLVNEYIVVS